MMKMSKRYVIVDISNLLFRSLYGVKAKNAEEGAANAFFMAITNMKNAWRLFNPDHIVVAFDGNSWRKDVYPEYKANRKEYKTDYERQVREMIGDIMNKFQMYLETKTNITSIRAPRAEADDVIAHWVQQHPNDEHFILTNDSDFRQLLDDNVTLYDSMTMQLVRNDGVWYRDKTPRQLRARLNQPKKTIHGLEWKGFPERNSKKEIIKEQVIVEPAFMLFMKIMRGDVSDNITRAAPLRYPIKKLRECFNDPSGKLMTGLMDRKQTAEKDVDDPTVGELFVRNATLIDLTMIPDFVKEQIDDAIEAQQNIKIPRMMEAEFKRFCREHDLISLDDNSANFLPMLFSKDKAHA